jgi:hypothetical protein
MFKNRWLIFFLMLSVPMLPAAAGAKRSGAQTPLFERKERKEVRPVFLLGKGTDLVAIFPCTSRVVFEDADIQPESPSHGPGSKQAAVSITAQSPLPIWGVFIEPPVLQGLVGTLPPERFWVRSEATENEFCSLEHPVALLLGGGHEGPLREVSFDMQLRPTWLDQPGPYSGHITVRPFLPRYESIDRTDLDSDERLGSAQRIPVELEIPDAIATSFSGTDLRFNVDAGPGVYPADRDVELLLSTNSPRWKVVYQGSDLIGDRGDVKRERLSWELLNTAGRKESSGAIDADGTVISGEGPVEDLKIKLRFKILITIEDPVGEYGGSISLLGLTDR